MPIPAAVSLSHRCHVWWHAWPSLKQNVIRGACPDPGSLAVSGAIEYSACWDGILGGVSIVTIASICAIVDLAFCEKKSGDSHYSAGLYGEDDRKEARRTRAQGELEGSRYSLLQVALQALGITTRQRNEIHSELFTCRPSNRCRLNLDRTLIRPRKHEYSEVVVFPDRRRSSNGAASP